MADTRKSLITLGLDEKDYEVWTSLKDSNSEFKQFKFFVNSFDIVALAKQYNSSLIKQIEEIEQIGLKITALFTKTETLESFLNALYVEYVAFKKFKQEAINSFIKPALRDIYKKLKEKKYTTSLRIGDGLLKEEIKQLNEELEGVLSLCIPQNLENPLEIKEYNLDKVTLTALDRIFIALVKRNCLAIMQGGLRDLDVINGGKYRQNYIKSSILDPLFSIRETAFALENRIEKERASCNEMMKTVIHSIEDDQINLPLFREMLKKYSASIEGLDTIKTISSRTKETETSETVASNLTLSPSRLFTPPSEAKEQKQINITYKHSVDLLTRALAQKNWLRSGYSCKRVWKSKAGFVTPTTMYYVISRLTNPTIKDEDKLRLLPLIQRKTKPLLNLSEKDKAIKISRSPHSYLYLLLQDVLATDPDQRLSSPEKIYSDLVDGLKKTPGIS